MVHYFLDIYFFLDLTNRVSKSATNTWLAMGELYWTMFGYGEPLSMYPIDNCQNFSSELVENVSITYFPFSYRHFR